MESKDDMMLVLLAGQSNMAGRGIATPEDLTAVPGLFFIAKDQQWRPAVEPITRDRAFIGAFHEDKSKAEPPAGQTSRRFLFSVLPSPCSGLPEAARPAPGESSAGRRGRWSENPV